MAIDAISSRVSAAVTPPAGPSDGAAPPADFGSALQNLMQSVDAANTDSNQAVGQMLDGTGDVHEAMIALQKADTMLQLTVQIRNKLVQAYQDVMRMSV